jgi:integrase
MARPRKTDTPDLKVPCDLTTGAIERLVCPPGRVQAFLRDAKGNGLRVRVTPKGKKSYVFEQSLRNTTIRKTIGTVSAWTIDEARAEAKRLSLLRDGGIDPRELERQRAAADAAEKAERMARAAAQAQEEAAASVTVRDAWTRYLSEGRPKRRAAWKPRYLADMVKMTVPGGEKRKRGNGRTLPGTLYPLMGLPLRGVNEDVLAAWFIDQSKRSAHQATRALMMFRGFLRWCAARPEYRNLVNRDAGKAPAILERLPAAERRTDALELAQVAGWWSAAAQLPNSVASAYLRALLLTGARREEMAALTWDELDLRWKKLTIADKVGDTRTLPLTPYLAAMLARLPRQKQQDGTASPYVFASSSKAGRIADPRRNFERANKEAGIGYLTIHGLRRSYALLGEAAGAPAGAIAQAMGHRPSAVHEGYKPRSVDALRPFLERVEAFILETVGEQFDPAVAPQSLILVGGIEAKKAADNRFRPRQDGTRRLS